MVKSKKSTKSLHPTVYEGDLKNGVPYGQGCVTHPSEAVYKVEFKDGKQHGQGCYTYPDGAVYDGGFTDGAWHCPCPGTYCIHMRMEAKMKESGRQTLHPIQVDI